MNNVLNKSDHEVYLIIFVLLFSLAGCKSPREVEVGFADGSYVGPLDKNGKKSGKGIYKWNDGSIYEGFYEDDLRSGKGTFTWANGESYQGDYYKDERTGKGIYSWPDGSIYKGDFLVGRRHGTGTFSSSSGTTYEGEWFDDIQHGEGVLTYSNGNVLKGTWNQGQLVRQTSESVFSSEKSSISTQKSTPKPVTSTNIEIDSNFTEKPATQKIVPVAKNVPLAQQAEIQTEQIDTVADIPKANFDEGINNDSASELENFPDPKNGSSFEVTGVKQSENKSLISPLSSFDSVPVDSLYFELGYSDLKFAVDGETASFKGPSFGIGFNKTLLNSSNHSGVDLDFSFSHTDLSRSSIDTDLSYYSASLRPFFDLVGDRHFLILGYCHMDVSLNAFDYAVSEDESSHLLGWGHQFNFKDVSIPLELEFSELGDLDIFEVTTEAVINFSDNYDLNFKYHFDSIDTNSPVSINMHSFMLGISKDF